MKSTKKTIQDLERMVSIRIIQEDVENIFSLMQTERDPIFAMEIMPYYALFIQACQEYMGETFIQDKFAIKIKDIRNFIKVYGEGFGKSKRRIEALDIKQDEQYRSQLKFDFMKKWNIHLNLGTYWTSDKHIVGNTQMLADFLGIDGILDPKNRNQQYELGKEIGYFVASIRRGIAEVINPPEVNRLQKSISIDYYYDLNTNKNSGLFVDDSTKALNLFLLNMTCNINFVKYILRPLFEVENTWVFRVEYIVTYYTCRAIQRLINYCENNSDLQIDVDEFADILDLSDTLFRTKFRNCMMHYGLENREVISMENIEKPFYGIVETCYDGKNYDSFLKDLRDLSDKIIVILEGKFNMEKVILQQL